MKTALLVTVALAIAASASALGGEASAESNYAATCQKVRTNQEELTEKLLRYTERHPEVIAQRKEIARLRELAGQYRPDLQPEAVCSGVGRPPADRAPENPKPLPGPRITSVGAESE